MIGRAARRAGALFALTVLTFGCSSTSGHQADRPSTSPTNSPTSTSAPGPTAPGGSRSTTNMAAGSPPSSSTTAAPGDALDALAGRVITIDPGHNGGNAAHPSEINRYVDYGDGTKACDTVGAETATGYAEHAFNWDVALRLQQLLQQHHATVILTRSSDDGVGPCIDQRAAIGNQAHTDAAISIHADGGPTGSVGFHVIWPADLPRTHTIVAPSLQLAEAVRDAYQAGTGESYATYVGAANGLVQRSDLGGLDLSTVPKVFIECLNLRDPTDAAKAEDPGFRQRIAAALAEGLGRFLARR